MKSSLNVLRWMKNAKTKKWGLPGSFEERSSHFGLPIAPTIPVI